MVEIGYSVLVLASVVSFYAVIASFLSLWKHYPRLTAISQNSVIITFGLVSVAVGVLLFSLVTHNFQLSYVANYTSRQTPLPYLFSALWAGNEGSLLVWSWLLCLFTFVFFIQERKQHKQLMSSVIAITMLIEAFFLSLIVFGSNPFSKLPSIPSDGRGLNPLLEHPLMIFHPPTLLAGYVGFSVPFALTVAKLIVGNSGDYWLRSIRKWVLISWLFLGIGNILGAWWAYEVLGWGGYWAWDPVENAGLMPWLVSTALLHSLIIQKRKGILQTWNATLIIITFVLTIFGTFLTRSGILPSVHAFAESHLGPAFLGLIGVTLLGSFGLLAHRSLSLKTGGGIDFLWSREAALLLNSFLFLTAAFVVFIGTAFPLISEIIFGVKLSVTVSFFNRLVSPIFLALILFLGIGSRINWQQNSPKELKQKLLHPFISAALLMVFLFLLGIRNWYALIGFFSCTFAIILIFSEWLTQIKKATTSISRYSAFFIHLGVILIAIGVIGSSLFSTETQVSLKPGETFVINQYVLKYEETRTRVTPDRKIVATTLTVFVEDKPVKNLTIEKSFYPRFDQVVTKVAIYSTLKGDLYLILASWTKDIATFKVLLFPLVVWIWIGGFVILFGTVIALLP